MKTFKRNKNLKKRSYHRKKPPASLFLLHHSTLIVISFIIIAISATASLAIQNNLLDKLTIVTLPKIQFSVPTIHPNTSAFVQASTNFISTIKIMNAAIALLAIQASAMLLNISSLTYQFISALSQTIFNGLSTALSQETAQISTNSTLLIQNLWSSSSSAITNMFANITTASTVSVQIVWRICSSGITTLLTTLITVSTILVQMLWMFTTNQITNIFTNSSLPIQIILFVTAIVTNYSSESLLGLALILEKSIEVCGYMLLLLSRTLQHLIYLTEIRLQIAVIILEKIAMSAISFSLTTIDSFFSFIFRQISLPFIAIKHALDQLAPYWQQLTNASGKSLGELFTNLKDISAFLFKQFLHRNA